MKDESFKPVVVVPPDELFLFILLISAHLSQIVEREAAYLTREEEENVIHNHRQSSHCQF